MTLTIPLAAEVEARLKRRAAAQGEDFPEYVAKLLSHFADPPTPLEEISGPIYERFLASGMTDDELGDIIEKAKHEARAERRARQRQ